MDDSGCALVAGDAHGRVQGNLPEDWDVVALGNPLAAACAEERKFCFEAAVFAECHFDRRFGRLERNGTSLDGRFDFSLERESRHVLDDADDRHVDGLEHVDGLVDVVHTHVLRRCDDDGAHEVAGLREGKLRVARARRHVDDKVVEFTPAHLEEELLDGLVDHGPTPDDGLVFVHHETKGHDLEPIGRLQGDDLLAFGLGLA